MIEKVTVFLTVILAGITTVRTPAHASIDDPFKNLPAGWKVVSTYTAPANQMATFSEKLGGSITELTNTILSVDGARLQVNIICCETSEDAEAVYRSMLGIKKSPVSCLRVDNSVVEFVGDDLRIIKQAHYALGFRPRTATYSVKFEAATINKADYMSCNALFNLLLALKANPDDAENTSQIRSLSKKFVFGKSLALRTGAGSNQNKPIYIFSPKSTQSTPAASADVTKYTFADLPKTAGVPYVSVEATITCYAPADSPTDRKSGPELLDATTFWPVRDREIRALADEITSGKNTAEEKVDAILEWLLPGKNIQFGGPVTGSRYGVKKALAQGYGRCWDFSDLFVTLCRASGVPCRQVAGWLLGQCGHVWAEALMDGKRWRQVDPAGGGACDTDYIPWFTTEDGEMPIVYLSMPKIQTLESSTDKPDSQYAQ